MNRGTLVTAVRTQGGWTTDDGVLTDAVVQSFVYEALQAIAIERDWDWQETTETIATVAGTDAYTPGATYGKTLGLRITSEYGPHLRYVSLEEADGYLRNADARGEPQVYTTYGGQLLLRPIPDAVYSLKHYFQRVEPALSSDSSEPLMPAQYHPAIVHLATSLAWDRVGDEMRASAERGLYKAWSDRMVDDRRRTTRPKKVRPRDGHWY